MQMTETALQPIDIMLVLAGDELWGAERLRADLAAAGLRLMLQTDFYGSDPAVRRMPAAILAFLSGQPERDAAVCRRWAGANLAPVLAVSPNADEAYVLALFEAGVEDVIPRPVRPRELAARIRSILRRTRPELSLPQPSAAAPQAASAPDQNWFSFIHRLPRQLLNRKCKKGVTL